MANWLKENDPWITPRMRKSGEISEAELAVLRASAKAMDQLLRTARNNLLGQPNTNNLTAASGFDLDTAIELYAWPAVGVWEQLVTDLILPAVEKVFDQSARQVRNRTPLSTDIWRSAYLGMVSDRLRLWSTEAFNYVRGFVAQSIADGTGITELTKQLTELLKVTGAVDGQPVWEWQARRIARTETIGAYNGGAYYEALTAAEDPDEPARYKMWLATDDADTRHTHNIADGQPALLADGFQVGDASLLFPGDPLGPAGEVIQCRCTWLLLDEDEYLQATRTYSTTPQGE